MSEQINIPKHWEVKRLGEVCEKAASVKRKEKNPQDEFAYFDIGGIDNLINKIKSFKIYRWEDAPSRAQQLIFEGDVLFSTVRTYMKNIALVDKKEFNGQIASSGFCVIRGNSDLLETKYIFYYTLSDRFLNPLNELQTGSSYPAVRDKDVFSQLIPIPPLAEQQRIVSRIEELLSELDNGKQQLITARQQLKVYRQSLLKAAFEGRLTNKEVKEGELPMGWKWVKMGEIIERPQYGTSKKCDYAIDGIGVLRIPNIANGRIDSSDLKFAKFELEEIVSYQLKDGDILTIRCNGSVDLVGKCALIKPKDECFLYAGYLIRLRPKQDLVLPKYLLSVLGSSFLRNQIENKAKSTSGVNNINSEELKSLDIPICSLEEQQLIVSELESKLTLCDKVEETINVALAQSDTLRQSILKKAFEGRLV